MKKTVIKFFGSLVLASSWIFAGAQALKDYPHNTDSSYQRSLNRKWRFGFDLNVFGSTIKGSQLNGEYFAKPSVGIMVSAEYRLAKFASVSIGAGYQQLGAGTITKIYVPVTGTNPDSTYRQRLRFNTFVLPISVHLRTPKDLKGWRLSGSASFVPLINASSHDVYNSIEPTIRVLDVNKDVSNLYFKNDMLLQFAIGPEVMVATGTFRFHFVYTVGTANVYSTAGSGHSEAIGVRIGYLF